MKKAKTKQELIDENVYLKQLATMLMEELKNQIRSAGKEKQEIVKTIEPYINITKVYEDIVSIIKVYRTALNAIDKILLDTQESLVNKIENNKK